jgi:nitric oxide reductase NorE protein
MSNAAMNAPGSAEANSSLGNAGLRIPGQPDMWAFVMFEALIFSSYFIVYMIRRAMAGDHFLPAQEHLSQGFGVANTLILLLSSWFMAGSVRSARIGKYNIASRQVLLTAACGLLFVGLKLLEWSDKIGEGLTLSTDEFFSFYYFLTAIHVLHVLFGFVVLAVAARELRGPPRRSQEIVETCATYWHMIDFLWVLIFALLYVMR